VVSYDDKRDGGAFELLNSIGTHFGTEGYGWITYKAFEKRVCYAMEVFFDTDFTDSTRFSQIFS
jgi:C1A family cysteine protease